MTTQFRSQELRDLTMRDVLRKVDMPADDFDDWLRQLGLLPTIVTCSHCAQPMRPDFKARTFTCNRRGCRTGPTRQTKPKKGWKTGSFFEQFNASHQAIFHLSYLWCFEYGRISDKCREVGLGHNTVTLLERTFCEITAAYFVRNQPSIGGPEVVVKVDETCIFKAKYHRGRRFRRHCWFFGGIERGSNRCFFQVVQHRDAFTLLFLVAKYIRPGTAVITDCWRSYNSLTLLSQAYRHLTVNHQLNSISPQTGAHTQTVESLWQKLKFQAKKRYGINNSRYSDYLMEFMWRREFGSPDMIFYELWDQISCHYPVQ